MKGWRSEFVDEKLLLWLQSDHEIRINYNEDIFGFEIVKIKTEDKSISE